MSALSLLWAHFSGRLRLFLPLSQSLLRFILLFERATLNFNTLQFLARLTLSSCPTRARPIEQTTQLSAYKLNRFSKEHGSLQKHLICAYPSDRHSQKSEWHSMNVPLGRHPNELHMVVTPRKNSKCRWREGAERGRDRGRERERENGKKLESERSLCSCLLRGWATRQG